MADEITYSATLSYSNGVTIEDLAVLLATKSPSGTGITRITQTITFSGEIAINLGGITAPGYAIFINRDPTNYIDLKTGTSGVIFARLDPDTNSDKKGGAAFLKLGSGAQAPYALANTGDCKMDTLIIPT